MDPMVTFVERVLRHVAATQSEFAVNAAPAQHTDPIPFFGDPLTAEALTVGVNPSAAEFGAARWPDTLTPAQLTARLRTYFTTQLRAPHPWFLKWTEAMAPLGYDYRRNLAHVDISPRATVSMSAAPDKAAFVRMLEVDAPIMFTLLARCPLLRAIFLAGAVSNREYMFEFVKRLAPASGFRLDADGHATEDRARQAPRFFKLHGHGRSIPVFFVGNSPSSRHVGRMTVAFADSYSVLRARGLTASP